MIVKCIKKPDEGYVARNVTIGNYYAVKSDSKESYGLIDDNEDEYYYPKDHFEEI